MELYIVIEEGSGCNMQPEDYNEGYIGYFNVEAYTLSSEDYREYEGGELLFTEERYSLYLQSAELLINDSLDLLFDNVPEYTLLESGTIDI